MKPTCSIVLMLGLIGSMAAVDVQAKTGPIEAAIAREAAQLAAAQRRSDQIDASWARATTLAPGTRMVVTVKGAGPVQRRFVSGDETGVVVSNSVATADPQQAVEKIARPDVLEIKLPAENPGSPGGAILAGGLTFALIGLPLAVVLPFTGMEPTLAALSGVGMSLGVGYLAYRKLGRKPERIIYRAPYAPLPNSEFLIPNS